MILSLPETVSTNDDVLGRAREGAAEGLWIRADRQSGGRGRSGRPWISPPGNLYASGLVRLQPGDPHAPGLALVAAVAVEEVAAAYVPGAALMLKWPNDLLADGAKVAGILLEREGDAVAVGIGVNLVHSPDLPDRPATSLAALGGGAPDPETFLVDLAAAFFRWLARWRSEGLGPVRRHWLERAHPLGSALIANGMTGLFDGLDDMGALRLRLADGSSHVIQAGDVFLIQA